MSPLQAILATPQSQNSLKMGCFRTKNKSKMDQKCVFPKIPLDYLGCTNKWNEYNLSPCWAILAPLKAERALKMGHFGTTNGSKNRSKHWFSKHDPTPVVVPKLMNTAHFEPHLSRSRPLSSAYLVWKPPKVGGCRRIRCARDRVLSHVARDMVFFWFGVVGGQFAQILELLGDLLRAGRGHIVELEGPSARGSLGACVE